MPTQEILKAFSVSLVARCALWRAKAMTCCLVWDGGSDLGIHVKGDSVHTAVLYSFFSPRPCKGCPLPSCPWLLDSDISSKTIKKMNKQSIPHAHAKPNQVESRWHLRSSWWIGFRTRVDKGGTYSFFTDNYNAGFWNRFFCTQLLSTEERKWCWELPAKWDFTNLCPFGKGQQEDMW